MTVSQLKKYLETCDNDALVVVPGRDHNYRLAHASRGVAVDDGVLSEDAGPEQYEDPKDYRPVSVVVFE